MAKLAYRLYYLDRKKALEPDRTYRIGRGQGNDVRLTGLTVSRRHARLFWEDGHFVIEDAKSTNGLFVNGRRLERRVLYDGDHIAAGTCYLVYREFDPEREGAVDVERELSDTLCIEHQMAELLQAIGDKRLRARLFMLKRTVDRARRKLDLLANRDRLTKLFNRRYFDEELDREIERARRYGDELPLLMIDLDRFKEVNDEHGHRKGDQALAAVAAVILEHTRRNDLAARYGGEEIAVIVPAMRPGQAMAAAEKLRALIERETPGRVGLPVTASIGVALYQEGDTAASLVGKADRALYEAKRRGRNKVIVYPYKRDKSDERT